MIEVGIDNELLASLRRLSDVELVAQVKDLAARERLCTAAVVAHLSELDTRDIHLREGYSSLFAYSWRPTSRPRTTSSCWHPRGASGRSRSRRSWRDWRLGPTWLRVSAGCR